MPRVKSSMKWPTTNTTFISSSCRQMRTRCITRKLLGAIFHGCHNMSSDTVLQLINTGFDSKLLSIRNCVFWSSNWVAMKQLATKIWSNGNPSLLSFRIFSTCTLPNWTEIWNHALNLTPGCSLSDHGFFRLSLWLLESLTFVRVHLPKINTITKLIVR